MKMFSLSVDAENYSTIISDQVELEGNIFYLTSKIKKIYEESERMEEYTESFVGLKLILSGTKMTVKEIELRTENDETLIMARKHLVQAQAVHYSMQRLMSMVIARHEKLGMLTANYRASIKFEQPLS